MAVAAAHSERAWTSTETIPADSIRMVTTMMGTIRRTGFSPCAQQTWCPLQRFELRHFLLIRENTGSEVCLRSV